MNRRSPVRSVLEERKMFSNGGRLPISTPSQNAASGILASSPSLIDAVSENIISSLPGGPRPMAEGGIAKFNEGGFSPGTLGDKYGLQTVPEGIDVTMVPSLTPTRTFIGEASIGGDQYGPSARQGVQATYDPKNPPVSMSYGEILVELPSEKVSRIFPDWTKTTQTLSFEDQYPGFSERASKGVPASRFEEGSARALQGARSFVKGSLEEMGQDVESVWKYLFSGETREDGTNLGQTRAVLEMIQRRPTLEADIKILARKAVTDNPGLSPDKLAESVAMGLSDKHEGQPHIGHADAAFDAQFNTGRGEVDAGAFTTPTPDALPSGNLTYEDSVKRESERMKAAMDRGPAASNMQDPTGPYDIPSILAGSESGREAGGDPLVDATEFSSVAEAEAEALGMVEPDDEAAGEAEGEGIARLERTWVKAASEQTVLDLSKLFDKKMSPEKATKTLADYKKEFLDEMPEYKGMSEEEKGWAIAEAGLRVAAGTSEYAMVNFAEGLKGLGDTFAKDEKEKRSWDRQIDLSAAKYALESVATADTKADALAKEGRVRKQFIVGKTFTDPSGVTREVGSLYTPTAADMALDSFQRSILPNLTTEGIYKERIDNAGTLTGIVRVGAKYGPSSESVKNSLNEYTDLTKDVRNNAKMLTMLDASIVQNARGQVTGIMPWASKKLNQLKNSVGYKKQIKLLDSLDTSTGAGLEKFQYQQQVIANMMLKEILGEGSKNVSNIDRTLAGEIVGLLRGISTIYADDKVLHQKLQGIRGIVDQGLKNNLIKMRNSETAYNNVFTAFAPGPGGTIIPGRSVSGDMASQRDVLLKDIYSVGQRAQETAKSAGRGPIVLRASDYFNLKDMTVKKKIPGSM